MHYWAEKCQAADKSDGVIEFSRSAFMAAVNSCVDDYLSTHEWIDASSVEILRQCVSDQVMARLDDDPSGHAALAAAVGFQWRGMRILDDVRECTLTEFSQRFQWACHALEWAVARYDARKIFLSRVA
jgi:hypothetical protein